MLLPPRSSRQHGFTLIEMAVVLVIIGVVISIVVTILPSLLRTAKVREAQAILERANYAVDGYIAANGRCPCPDTDGDGVENRNADDTCASFDGDLPYQSLGLSSGIDNWQNPIRYGVHEDLTTTDTSTICAALNVLVAAAGTPDTAKLHTVNNGNTANQAYIMASGGSKDLDSANGFFDGLNGAGVDFDSPSKNQSPDYDDLVRSVSPAYLNGKTCSGGSGVPGGGANTETNCINGIDDDLDGAIDCEDSDCADDTNCADSANVEILKDGPVMDFTMGESIPSGISFHAVGGQTSPDYDWELVSVPAELSDKLSLNKWTGTLSGDMSVCFSGSPYTIRVKATERAAPYDDDEEEFQITVRQSSLSVLPLPTSLPDPDFTIDGDNATTFSQLFSLNGDTAGTITWGILWSTTDPGGFQLDVQSDGEEARFWKSGANTEGEFSFRIVASDGACTANTVTSDTYVVEITADGANSPLTEDLSAHWKFDECSWTGDIGEVKDEDDNAIDGIAVNGATTSGYGHNCRSGFFDGTDDHVNFGDILNDVFGTSNNQFTVAAWINPASFTAGVTNHQTSNCFIANASDAVNDNLEIGLNSSGSIHVYIDAGGADEYADFGGNDISLNTWHFVAVTYNGSAVNVTIDDKKYENNTTWAGGGNLDSAAGSFFTIGATLHEDNFFNGNVDEVMVFSRVLTDDEISDIYDLKSTCSGSCFEDTTSEYRMENFPWVGADGEVIDSGSSGNNGVASTTASGTRPTQTSPSSGKVCRSGEFVRANQSHGGYLDLGDPGSLDPGTSPLTIATWVKWDGSSGENIIYNKETLVEARVSGGYLNYAWQPHWVWDGGTSFPVSAGEWVHVTTVYDGKRQVLYKNGEQVYSRSQTGAIGANSSRFLIGARGSTSPRNFFGGQIDEFRIYNRPLGENEIRDVMESTRDCGADSVYITTTELPSGTMGANYQTTIGATGGSTPYGWDIPSSEISSLIISPTTGVLSGPLNLCSGTYQVTVTVEDADSRSDERTYSLTVDPGTLSFVPDTGDFTCDTTTFYQDFSITGPLIGDATGWTIDWLGTNPGGFELLSTGSNTVRLRKSGASASGQTYQFKIKGEDASCPANTFESGFYTVTVTASGAGVPYYLGMNGEWQLDECTWNGTAGEIIDSGGAEAHGQSAGFDITDDDLRAEGRVCASGAFNLGTTTDQSVSLGVPPFQALSAFSLSVWVRPVATHSNLATIFSGARAGSFNQMIFALSSNADSVRTYLSETQSGTFSIGSTLMDGGWHHLVWTWNGASGTEEIYVNGVPLSDSNGASYTGTLSLDPGGAVLAQEQDSVGGGFDPTQRFSGWIDEVRVYNRVVTSDEVSTLGALSHACSGSCYTPPVAEFRMNETAWTADQAGDVVDSSGNNYHGTPRGSTEITSDAPPSQCRSGLFSNSDSDILVPGLPVSSGAGDKTTVTFWMKWGGGNSQMPMGWDNSYDLYISSNRIGFNTGGGDIYGVAGADALIDSWHHIAAVFTNNDTASNQLYIDGVLQSISLLQGTQNSRLVSSNLYLSGWGRGNYMFNGGLDEIRVYSRALSASEVGDDMRIIHSCE